MAIDKDKLLGEDSLDIIDVNSNTTEIKTLIDNIMSNLFSASNSDDFKNILSFIILLTPQIIKDVIPYADIHNYIFSEFNYNPESIDKFLENLDNFSDYLKKNNKNNTDDDHIKIGLKIVQYSQLSFCQISQTSLKIDEQLKLEKENIIRKFNEEINNTKLDIEKAKKDIEEAKHDVKDAQKDNITILGIFSSVVLTFVGGAIFSTSVLENIHKVNIFRLLLIVDFIGFILTNTISILTNFIFKINDKNNPFELKIDNLNNIFFYIAIAIITAYLVFRGFNLF